MTDNNNTLTERLSQIVFIIVAIYAAVVCYKIITQEKQWDFNTYYHATQTYEHGLNPCDTNNVMDGNGDIIALPYVYPPITLQFFRPFTFFSYSISYYLFFIFKLSALALLLFIWYRFFLPDKKFAALLFLLAAFAFREAIIRDLYAGNISVFEQLLLWSAVYFFINHRPRLFATLIAVAALFKFTLIVFLLLLLLDRKKEDIIAMLTAGGAFILLNLVSIIVAPELFEAFLANASELTNETYANQSSIMFIRALLENISSFSGMNLAYLETALHIAVAMLVMAFFRRTSFSIDFKNNRLDLVLLSFFAYALIMPRMKDYSCILLIIPTLYVITTRLKSIWSRAIAVFFVTVSFLPFQALLTAGALYGIYITRIQKRVAEEA